MLLAPTNNTPNDAAEQELLRKSLWQGTPFKYPDLPAMPSSDAIYDLSRPHGSGNEEKSSLYWNDMLYDQFDRLRVRLSGAPSLPPGAPSGRDTILSTAPSPPLTSPPLPAMPSVPMPVLAFPLLPLTSPPPPAMPFVPPPVLIFPSLPLTSSPPLAVPSVPPPVLIFPPLPLTSSPTTTTLSTPLPVMMLQTAQPLPTLPPVLAMPVAPPLAFTSFDSRRSDVAPLQPGMPWAPSGEVRIMVEAAPGTTAVAEPSPGSRGLTVEQSLRGPAMPQLGPRHW